MSKPKHAAQIDNIYFLSRIGLTLRLATADIAREELPVEIRLLLNRLDRFDAKARLQTDKPDNTRT